MENINCLQCKFRHPDNGNCMEVGGFCTAVPAAYCPLLRQYLGTWMTPEQVVNAKTIIESAFADDTSKAERIRNLMAADDEGRVVVLPCKVGDTVYFVNAKQILEFAVVGYSVDETGISWVYSEHVDKTAHTYERTFSPDRFGKNTFFTREEAEKALQEMDGKA